ncbi:MAG: MurR/RpiR family transcriptional regulator [Alkalibacterium gilvum]|uniref:Transcriptional regulator, RpiR family n=1 Tax=Alkalibacterium gilvum TaxID=1130080 RepID=A0A1H6VFW1_9LACT|nr:MULTISPECIES: MurR/RpiR family transcriptional regulator [Alkalibacterium]MDN6293755.1 MurR/RpiR family transcriptional regulator [Alkalibacterium sp.]MDN6294892.1 MurR/RpiR family transcriptional regulator [Alkalibacterium sp.]SEJ03433.1 transcriptional regulator, RpiR family [Alkalibacterium gilvum]HAJ69952.1 MurR/RpiR family transcriptional regulator [Alkalibacterium sp.]
MAIATLNLKEYKKDASPTEVTIIDYILKNTEETSHMTIYDLSEKTFSSPSTIIRLCKKTGYKGYKDFLKDLIYEQAVRSNYKQKHITELTRTDEIEEIVNKVTYKNILSLEETEKLIDIEMIKECVKQLFECEKLTIFGIGASLLVAKDAQLKFTRIDKMSYVSEDWHTQLLMAKNMGEKDVALVISYSGQTEEMITCAEVAKENGATIISITKTEESPINTLADYPIYVSSNEFSFRSGAMSSRIAQLNVIDILFTTYINKMYEESIEILEKTQIKKERE